MSSSCGIPVRDWVTEGADAELIEARIEALSTAIWKRLVLVTIDLDPGDNAQVIFETLNARGTPLLAADLIKNHLFQTATLQDADIGVLWEKHWKGLDTDWWREEVRQGRLIRPRLDIWQGGRLGTALPGVQSPRTRGRCLGNSGSSTGYPRHTRSTV